MSRKRKAKAPPPLPTPAKKYYDRLPQDVWITIASFLPPDDMKDLEVALMLPDSIADLASKSVFRNLREVANNFWKACVTKYARGDNDLVLEQLVAQNALTPPTTQLYIARESNIARESLRVWTEHNIEKCLFDDESWHGLYTFLYRFMDLFTRDPTNHLETVPNMINVFRHREHFLAMAMWITIGEPLLPIYLDYWCDYFYIYENVWCDYCYDPISFRYGEELKDLISETRMEKINDRPYGTTLSENYNDLFLHSPLNKWLL